MGETLVPLYDVYFTCEKKERKKVSFKILYKDISKKNIVIEFFKNTSKKSRFVQECVLKRMGKICVSENECNWGLTSFTNE